MPESYCVELKEPEESAHGLGWFVRALRTELGTEYYLTKGGTVEADMAGANYADFYFDTKQHAFDVMEQYFDDWSEPFTFQHLNREEVVQLNESQKMKFI